MGEHITKKQAEIGKALPLIPGHPVYKRFFTVYHFIVGKGEHEIFRKGIGKTKGYAVLMVLSVNGFLFEVLQGIVHPTHHPLHAKTKTSEVHWLRDPIKGSRLLGNGLNSIEVAIHGSIQLSNEGHGL